MHPPHEDAWAGAELETVRATTRSYWLPIVAVVLARSSVSAWVLLGGFRAVSDDDYARVVLAQSFAVRPTLDPSGTSWLPFPFWVQGSVMRLFGRSLEIAQATALGEGILSALAVLLASHWWFQTTRRGALFGALLASVLPYSVWLGVATVPDGPTAALLLVAMGASVAPNPRRCDYGGLALLMATLSRYEAWPVALVYSAMAGVNAVRTRNANYLRGAALALFGPTAWMIHGALAHHDPCFFVARVAAYRRAIGASPASALTSAMWYPLALVRYEPELMSLLGLSLLFTVGTGRRQELLPYGRPMVLAAALITFLIVGDMADGAATHHRERTLLSAWLLAAVLAGHLLDRLLDSLTWRGRIIMAAMLLPVLAGSTVVVRPTYAPREAFVDRSQEVALGRLARFEAGSRTGKLLVGTQDYGYFAVIAAFGEPDQALPLDDHDPRRPPVRPWSSAAEFCRHVDQARASWLVIDRRHQALVAPLGAQVAEQSRLVLYRLHPRTD